ncbi:phosphotriesterase family protein [Bifidobacterium margollesii]|uniref:Phosphotriesterase family protein n=1 Tax=Bifidobacterium margollesii TaxID=2020964 RepID=A0A2N5JD24_9BIFI|nr:phosphotriesterase-related protein [Bifidobacterium margollesii]PLS32120.1 phosphotriesterase family protein [Bifidobacterium margollesii]
MGRVQTVLGNIDVKDMGYTMPHEHILTCPQGHGSKVEEDHLLNSYSKAVAMLREYKADGGGTLVEATPKTWGRDAVGMKYASEATGVNVVACTGYICQEHGMPDDLGDWDIERVIDEMVKDITVGMDGTDIKAGWIKVGTAYLHITPGEEKVIRAACRAAKKTGVSVHAHTTIGTMGLEILKIVQEEDFDTSRFAVAHVDRNPDLWYHRKMLETGCSLIYDGPGKAKYYPDSMRVDLLKHLVDEGYASKLMMCNDMGRRSHHKVYGFGPGFNYIKDVFLPRLIDEGLDEQVVHDFMYANPQKFYEMRDPE